MHVLLDNLPDASIQLGAIFQAFSDLLFVLDGEGTILDYRAGDTALLYTPPEIFLGQRMQDILPRQVGDKYQRIIQQVMQSKKTASLEYSLTIANGERWFEARFVPHKTQIIVVIRDITRYKQAEEEVQHQLERLAALRSIDTVIASSLDLNLTLSMLLSHVAAQLNIDAADILLINLQNKALEFASGIGFRTDALQHTHLRMGEGYAGLAALQQKVISIPNLPHRKTGFSRSSNFQKESFTSYYGVPLISKGQVCGVLEILHRTPLNPKPDWLNFMQTLADQAAIAIENAMLFKELQRSNVELTFAYDATIEGWSRALDLRDRDTEGHTKRVTELTARLARHLGLKDAELMHIRWGAILHDIGKMAIPDSILLKSGSLTTEEWEIIRQHPRYAYELLSPIPYLRPVLDIPHYHHEKWDGTGYPHGLKGEQIPLPARLFAVVDVFDALTSDRPYRPAWSHREALKHIRNQTGKHFDPRAAAAFLKMVKSED